MSGSDVIVNVSYCQAHRKRPRDERLDGLLHARWLEQCVGHLRGSGYPVVVSATCWSGMSAVEPAEREVLLRIMAQGVSLLTYPDVGHQEGAARAIALGLNFALHFGYRHMIHTAEDVAVAHDSLRLLADLLREGHDYVGSDWDGVVHGRAVHGLNSQFFGANVARLYACFDPAAAGAGTLEEVLRGAVGGGKMYLFPVEYRNGAEQHGPYEHTHDHGEWLDMMRRAGAAL